MRLGGAVVLHPSPERVEARATFIGERGDLRASSAMTSSYSAAVPGGTHRATAALPSTVQSQPRAAARRSSTSKLRRMRSCTRSGGNVHVSMASSTNASASSTERASTSCSEARRTTTIREPYRVGPDPRYFTSVDAWSGTCV